MSNPGERYAAANTPSPFPSAGESLCLSRADVEALTSRLGSFAFGYSVEAQAAAKVVRRMLDWLETTK